MSHCAGRCTVNAPSGCCGQSGLAVCACQEHTTLITCSSWRVHTLWPLPACACVLQSAHRPHAERDPGGRGGGGEKKQNWESGNSGGHRGPAAWIYTRNVWSWHTFVWSHGKWSRVARQSCNPLCPLPPLFWSAYVVLPSMRTRKGGRKKMTQKAV